MAAASAAGRPFVHAPGARAAGARWNPARVSPGRSPAPPRVFPQGPAAPRSPLPLRRLLTPAPHRERISRLRRPYAARRRGAGRRDHARACRKDRQDRAAAVRRGRSGGPPAHGRGPADAGFRRRALLAGARCPGRRDRSRGVGQGLRGRAALPPGAHGRRPLSPVPERSARPASPAAVADPRRRGVGGGRARVAQGSFPLSRRARAEDAAHQHQGFFLLPCPPPRKRRAERPPARASARTPGGAASRAPRGDARGLAHRDRPLPPPPGALRVARAGGGGPPIPAPPGSGCGRRSARRALAAAPRRPRADRAGADGDGAAGALARPGAHRCRPPGSDGRGARPLDRRPASRSAGGAAPPLGAATAAATGPGDGLADRAQSRRVAGRGGTTEGRVLVVDDDEPIARMMAEFLAEHGFEADWAGGGRAALVKIKAEPPDAIVLDLRMPDMDGRALLAAVRASGLAPHVVLFSADREVAAAARELACEAFVEKPFAPESLLAAVRRALAPPLSPSK